MDDFVPLSSSKKGQETVPWVVETDESPLVQLHNEILRFVELVSLTEDEKSAREDAICAVREKICESVQVFGSHATGLCVFCSDVDVVAAGSSLSEFADALDDCDDFEDVQRIENASVPIVKFVHGGIAVDVSFVEGGEEMSAFTIDLLEALPALRPLTVVLKYFLIQRELNKVYDGGLGSLATFLTVVSFLQHRHRVDEVTGFVSTQNLGSLLLEYLQLYGEDLNLAKTGISVAKGGSYFPKKWSKNQRHAHFLQIANPLDPQKDVTQGSYNMPRLRRAYNHAYKSLVSRCASNKSSSSILSGMIYAGDPWLSGR